MGRPVAKSASETKRVKRPLKNCILVDGVRLKLWDGCCGGVDIGCEAAVDVDFAEEGGEEGI
jgi:hypothetical protein